MRLWKFINLTMETIMTDKKITLEKAQFILQKSEEYLNELKCEYKDIDNKTASIRNFLIIGIAAMFSTLNFVQESVFLYILILIGGFCYSLCFLIHGSKTEELLSMGMTSDKLLKLKCIKADLCFLILSYLSPHKECVEHVKDLIFKKECLYDSTVVIIIGIFIISLITIALHYYLF